MKSVVETCIQEVMGHAVDAEDLWSNFFCIAADYSLARQSVLCRGSLLKALRASVAIPGVLLPRGARRRPGLGVDARHRRNFGGLTAHL